MRIIVSHGTNEHRLVATPGLGAMPTALRGQASKWSRVRHAHAKPWAWHPRRTLQALRLNALLFPGRRLEILGDDVPPAPKEPAPADSLHTITRKAGLHALSVAVSHGRLHGHAGRADRRWLERSPRPGKEPQRI